MKIEDLVMLTKAGYTKEDIDALGFFGKPEAAPEEQPEQLVIPDMKEEAKPDAPEEDKYKALETKLDYVINRFNYLSVQNSKQPDEKGETLEDILSSVIR